MAPSSSRELQLSPSDVKAIRNCMSWVSSDTPWKMDIVDTSSTVLEEQSISPGNELAIPHRPLDDEHR